MVDRNQHTFSRSPWKGSPIRYVKMELSTALTEYYKPRVMVIAFFCSKTPFSEQGDVFTTQLPDFVRGASHSSFVTQIGYVKLQLLISLSGSFKSESKAIPTPVVANNTPQFGSRQCPRVSTARTCASSAGLPLGRQITQTL